MLFYWYTPQYLNSAYQLSEIKLPPRGKNCVDSYSPKLGSNWSIYRCGYGQTIIEKLISSKFAKSGSPALKVIKSGHWTAADQRHGRQPDRGEARRPGEGGAGAG